MGNRENNGLFRSNRRRLVKEAFAAGELECKCCGLPMYFYGHHTKGEYLHRYMSMTGTRRRALHGKKGAAIALQLSVSCDHIIPHSRGGSCQPENLMLMCKTCNEEKGDHLPSEWIHARDLAGKTLKRVVIDWLLSNQDRALNFHMENQENERQRDTSNNTDNHKVGPDEAVLSDTASDGNAQHY